VSFVLLSWCRAPLAGVNAPGVVQGGPVWAAGGAREIRPRALSRLLPHAAAGGGQALLAGAAAPADDRRADGGAHRDPARPGQCPRPHHLDDGARLPGGGSAPAHGGRGPRLARGGRAVA
jgi:hypothetical protein